MNGQNRHNPRVLWQLYHQTCHCHFKNIGGGSLYGGIHGTSLGKALFAPIVGDNARQIPAAAQPCFTVPAHLGLPFHYLLPQGELWITGFEVGDDFLTFRQRGIEASFEFQCPLQTLGEQAVEAAKITALGDCPAVFVFCR